MAESGSENQVMRRQSNRVYGKIALGVSVGLCVLFSVTAFVTGNVMYLIAAAPVLTFFVTTGTVALLIGGISRGSAKR
jgi:hypothetical protein